MKQYENKDMALVMWSLAWMGIKSQDYANLFRSKVDKMVVKCIEDEFFYLNEPNELMTHLRDSVLTQWYLKHSRHDIQRLEEQLTKNPTSQSSNGGHLYQENLENFIFCN